MVLVAVNKITNEVMIASSTGGNGRLFLVLWTDMELAMLRIGRLSPSEVSWAIVGFNGVAPESLYHAVNSVIGQILHGYVIDPGTPREHKVEVQAIPTH